MLVDQTLDPSTLHGPMHSTSIAWLMWARVDSCIRPFDDKCPGAAAVGTAEAGVLSGAVSGAVSWHL